MIYRNNVIHANCLTALPELPEGSVDFILTDPPYITRYKSRDGRTVPNDDNAAWLKPAFAEMYRVLAPDSFAVSFYGWPQADRFIRAYRDAGFRVVGHLAFPKRYTSATKYLRYQHECAHLLAKGNPKPPAETIGDVIDWTYSGNKLHPTQKPLSVLLPLTETFSAPDSTVLTHSPVPARRFLRQKCLAATTSAWSWTPNIAPSPPRGSRGKQKGPKLL